MQLDHWVVVDHEVEDPEEILEECSVREEEEASFWDTSLVHSFDAHELAWLCQWKMPGAH